MAAGGRFDVVGDPGVRVSGPFSYGALRGRYDDEFHRNLRGPLAARVYTEMGANDGTLGTCYATSTALMKTVPWTMQTGNDSPRGRQEGEFLLENWEDMKHKPVAVLSDSFTAIKYGWALFNMSIKYRRGKKPLDPLHSSKFNDGRIGIADLAFRSQKSLREWEWDQNGDLAAMIQLGRRRVGDIRIPIEQALHITTENNADNPEGLSFYRPAYRPWYFKKGWEENEGIGGQKDATGTLYATAPLEYFQQSPRSDIVQVRDLILDMLSGAYRNENEHLFFPAKMDSKGLPTGFDLGSLVGGGARQFDFDKIIQRWDRIIAALFNMQFIFYGGSGTGSQALSIDTTDMYEKTVDAFLTTIESALNDQVFAKIYDLNGVPIEHRARIVHGSVKKQDLKTFAETMASLIQSGLITPDDTLEVFTRDKMKLPPRDEAPEDLEDGITEVGDEVPQLTADEEAQDVPGDPPADPTQTGKRSRVVRGFLPNEAMRKAASAALAARKEMPAAQRVTDMVAEARGKDIAAGRPLSLATVTRMSRHFSAGADKRAVGWRTKGPAWQAWHLWGGDAGQRWANQVLHQVEPAKVAA